MEFRRKLWLVKIICEREKEDTKSDGVELKERNPIRKEKSLKSEWVWKKKFREKTGRKKFF